MFKQPLTQTEIEEEIRRIMCGEDSGSDWEEDNLEPEPEDSDDESDDDNIVIAPETPVCIPQRNLFQDPPTAAREQTPTEGEESETNILEVCSSLHQYLIKPNKTSLTGKNGHKWSATVPAKCKRTAARNIIHFIPGPKGNTNNYSMFDEYFLHFFSHDILEIILQHTNAEIARRAQKYQSHANISEITKNELKALFAILIMSAANKDNHLSMKHMFNTNISGKFYRACMSGERFSFLLNCLRFDNKETRQERVLKDPLAYIREIWDIFITTCRTSYTPSSYLTIDEQLVGFRGRCPFKIYIPNKPSKYGIKIVMLCDSSSKYMIDADPYLGKLTKRNGLPLASYYVKELTKSVHGSNRNVTMDNWFTSVPLADELLKDPYKLTILGTLRKNKKEIPTELLNVKGRNPNTSMFCYVRQKTLLSYMPKRQKIVLLLSTLHEGAEITATGKPAIIQNYNQTKGGVDTFDQMCSNMNSCRWLSFIFYLLGYDKYWKHKFIRHLFYKHTKYEQKTLIQVPIYVRIKSSSCRTVDEGQVEY
nr:piggyBac transposable element-derived protein 4-like [Onthophagus taurus]